MLHGERQRFDHGPRCFLHVPKCAGSSITEALKSSLCDDRIAPKFFDTFIFGQFSAFDQLAGGLRCGIAVDDAEVLSLADHDFVLGHFSLPTLRRLSAPGDIATVLREPRARLLSMYMYARSTRTATVWGQYSEETFEQPAQSLDYFLSHPRIAHLTDNQICRILLHGDPRIPEGDFIPPAQVEPLASDALAKLDKLGYVGILECDDVWGGLARFFNTDLEPVRENESGEGDSPDGALPSPFEAKTALALLERRNEADRIVYETLLGRRCGTAKDARKAADTAFAAQLVRFGDRVGTSAAKLAQLESAP